MKLSRSYLIWGVVVLLLLATVYFFTSKNTQGPVACTLDAKQCPDGSVVGRIGPDCEFEVCPDIER